MKGHKKKAQTTTPERFGTLSPIQGEPLPTHPRALALQWAWDLTDPRSLNCPYARTMPSNGRVEAQNPIEEGRLLRSSGHLLFVASNSIASL